MITKVFNTLKPLVLPLKWNKMPDFGTSSTVISYHFFNDGGLLYGDGLTTAEGGSLQIDVYSKTDYSGAVEGAKTLLIGAGFLFADGRDDTEKMDDNTELYHKILIFNYSKGRLK